MDAITTGHDICTNQVHGLEETHQVHCTNLLSVRRLPWRRIWDVAEMESLSELNRVLFFFFFFWLPLETTLG